MVNKYLPDKPPGPLPPALQRILEGRREFGRIPPPPPLPPGFPRHDWTYAELKYPLYRKYVLTLFEVALAAKKASIAWMDAARGTGNWQGSHDQRWFILAVADRAQQRKALKYLELQYDYKPPQTTAEWHSIIHTAVIESYLEAISTQDYPAEHTPNLKHVLPTLCNLLAIDIYCFSNSAAPWPYRRPLTTDDLGRFAPQRGDPEVLHIRWKYPDLVRVTELLRGSRNVILDWTVAPGHRLPPLPAPYASISPSPSASDEVTTASTADIAPIAEATAGFEELTVHDEASTIDDA